MSYAASNNAKQTRGRPFEPGNKFGKGRPVGSRNKTTVALQALIDGQAENVVQSMIEAANQGNVSAAKALLDRLVPPCKTAPLATPLMEVGSQAGFAQVALDVFNKVARGELTADEAIQVTGLLAAQAKLHETLVFEDRLKRIEEKLGVEGDS